MKYLRKGVDEFYRLRVIVTFKSGRTVESVYGPFTRKSKAREIRTRVERGWGHFWSRGYRPGWNPDHVLDNIQYIIEMLPSFGWHSVSHDTITAD